MKITNLNKVNRDRSYVNHIPLRNGEVTIVTSDSAEASMVHSCRFAAETQKAGVGTLVINCALSDKRFREYFLKHNGWSNSEPKMLFKSSVRGNLIGDAEDISQLIIEGRIGTVVIVGWEWTSSSWRRKQRLLHYLREIMDMYSVVVVVYSHCYNSPKPGHVDKGGLGKLALLAMFVVGIEASEQLEKDCPKPPPLVYKDLAERQAAERSAQLLINKINGIGGSDGRVSGTGVRVSEEAGVVIPNDSEGSENSTNPEAVSYHQIPHSARNDMPVTTPHPQLATNH